MSVAESPSGMPAADARAGEVKTASAVTAASPARTARFRKRSLCKGRSSTAGAVRGTPRWLEKGAGREAGEVHHDVVVDERPIFVVERFVAVELELREPGTETECARSPLGADVFPQLV